MTAPTCHDPRPVFADVQLLALMAAGKRTCTWDAYDTVRQTRCIVKVIRHERRHDPDIIDAVRTECRVLHELNHPHIVRGYGPLTGPNPDTPIGFAMQTVPGTTLDLLIDDGPLSATDTVQLGIHLASALQYLHRNDWIHLDVKPANVIVHGGQAVVIDLGLLSRPGDRRGGAGTRGYLAPEQADRRPLTTTADTFALGVTLLEALSGQMPFGDEATWESRRRIPLWHRRMPRRPRGFPDDLPPPLHALLAEMMSLDPACRPSAAEVAERLRAIAPTLL